MEWWQKHTLPIFTCTQYSEGVTSMLMQINMRRLHPSWPSANLAYQAAPIVQPPPTVAQSSSSSCSFCGVALEAKPPLLPSRTTLRFWVRMCGWDGWERAASERVQWVPENHSFLNAPFTFFRECSHNLFIARAENANFWNNTEFGISNRDMLFTWTVLIEEYCHIQNTRGIFVSHGLSANV